MKRTTAYFLAVLWMLAVIFTSCNDDAGNSLEPGVKSRELTVNLRVTAFASVSMQSRASGGLQNIKVYYYDTSGNYISNQTFTGTYISASNDGSCAINLTLPQDAATLHFVHFAETSAIEEFDPTTTDIKDFQTVWATSSPQNNPELMWATASAADLTAAAGAVELVCDHARVSVENRSDNDEFTLEGFGVYGTASKGFLTYESLTKPRVATSESYAFNLTDGRPNAGALTKEGYVAVYESESGHGRVIIKGVYKGAVYYYPVVFARYETSGAGSRSYTVLPILRNHHYKFRINSVNGPGHESLEEAYGAEPDNAMEVMVEDRNDEITGIVTGNGYAMGLSTNAVTLAGNATAVEFLVVTNYQREQHLQPTITAVADLETGAPCPWLKAANATMTLEEDYFIGGSNGYGYRVMVPVDVYENTSESRKGYVKVNVGELEMAIAVEQEARNYLSERKIIVRIPRPEGGYFQVDDYQSWIRNEDGNGCNGLRPEQNRGANRYDYLIFPPIPEFYGSNIEYYVEKRTYVDIPSKVEITVSGFSLGQSTLNGKEYWKITQTTTRNLFLTGQFIIPTYYDYDIVFQIRRMGFFHELTEDMLQYQGGSSPKTGWYYYEFSRPQGDHMLIIDRNIGASSNAPYDDTSVAYTSNADAAGGYFQIATKRFSTSNFTAGSYVNPREILDQLKLPESLTIPTIQEIEHAGITADGNCDNMQHIGNAWESPAADGKVYFPHAGYYAGPVKRNAGRCNFWLSDVYCTGDGFDPAQAQQPGNQFGYWYNFFNGEAVAGYTGPYGQVRCTDAVADDFSDASMNVYMPLRLIGSDY